MNKTSHPYFIANDAYGSRHETAVALTGAADEFGVDQRDIRTTRTGFRISQALADALDLDTSDDEGTEGEEADGPTPASATSADRVSTPAAPESDIGRSDAAVRQHESLGDEVPDPDADGAETREGVAANPTNPVEAETPVFVVEDGHTRVGPANRVRAFDPSESNIDGVKAYVTENPDSASAVLAREEETSNRKTLVSWLNEFISNTPVSDTSNTNNEE